MEEKENAVGVGGPNGAEVEETIWFTPIRLAPGVQGQIGKVDENTYLAVVDLIIGGSQAKVCHSMAEATMALATARIELGLVRVPQ